MCTRGSELVWGVTPTQTHHEVGWVSHSCAGCVWLMWGLVKDSGREAIAVGLFGCMPAIWSGSGAAILAPILGLIFWSLSRPCCWPVEHLPVLAGTDFWLVATSWRHPYPLYNSPSHCQNGDSVIWWLWQCVCLFRQQYCTCLIIELTFIPCLKILHAQL